MNRVHIAQASFVGGEVSPLVLGRSDTERFIMSGEVVQNFIARHQGPLVRRRGTTLVAACDCSAARIFNFEYSREDSELVRLGCAKIVVGT